MTFAEKLYTLRKQHQLSQEELADRLGVSRQAISRWEQGTVLPDVPNLIQISRLFSVSTDYLLGDDFASDKDIPAVKDATQQMLKENNRKIALTILVGLHALTFFWELMGYYVYQSVLIVLFGISMSILNIIAFEVGFHLKKVDDIEIAGQYRRKYYQISVWLFSLFPIRMVVVALFHLYSRPLSVLWLSLIVVAVYLLVCTMVTWLLRQKNK